MNFAIFATTIGGGLATGGPGCAGVRAMAEGDAAYAMAIESAAIAIAGCDLRLRPQLSEAFAEALELRGAAVTGGLYLKSAVIDVLEDVFERVVDLYAGDLVPVREQVLRERADALLRKFLAEVSTEYPVVWPFPEANGDGVN